MHGSAPASAYHSNPAGTVAQSLPMLRAGSRTAMNWSDLWVLVGSSIYLYLSLFTLRGTPFLLSGDQVFYWMDAERMMAGGRIYRDFFKFTPPGTDLLYFGVFRIFGLQIWVPNLIVLVLGVALTWVCLRVASLFLEGAHALLAAAFFLVFIYGALLNATHHLFSKLVVLVAVMVLMRGTTEARILLAGAAAGRCDFLYADQGACSICGAHPPAGPAHQEAYRLSPFRDFMRERYRQVWHFPDRVEVWQRK